jgi:hypothetical protein
MPFCLGHAHTLSMGAVAAMGVVGAGLKSEIAPFKTRPRSWFRCVRVGRPLQNSRMDNSRFLGTCVVGMRVG